MADKSLICKAELEVADIDRHYYATHSLTLAQHPSETAERLMLRLAAFALHASPELGFGGGVSTPDEPALWSHDPTGAIIDWIEVGLPETRLLKRAAGRAQRVFVYAYGRAAGPWWQQNGGDIRRIERTKVILIPAETAESLRALAARSMRLQCLTQDGEATLSSAQASVILQREPLTAV
jgi:uncharacterized protein YaeQ